MIRIIAVGKKHDVLLRDSLERYEARLRQPYNVLWQLLPHSTAEEQVARDEESKQILDKLTEDEYVVLLDETGKQLDSPALSKLCEWQFTHGRSVTFIIGGAYGVNKELQQSADMVLSFSKLVFPHQLMRLMLLEQIYRAQEIERGGNYHHV